MIWNRKKSLTGVTINGQLSRAEIWADSTSESFYAITAKLCALVLQVKGFPTHYRLIHDSFSRARYSHSKTIIRVSGGPGQGKRADSTSESFYAITAKLCALVLQVKGFPTHYHTSAWPAWDAWYGHGHFQAGSVAVSGGMHGPWNNFLGRHWARICST
jgi:hypothetical protein